MTPTPDVSVRLRDVATRASVSTATVARVIHDSGPVSQATRERVEAALAETGYRLNGLAQSLRTSQTRTVGHVLHELHANTFFAEVALGADAAASATGHRVVLFNASASGEREAAGVEEFLRRRVCAIIFTGPVDPRNVLTALRAGVRVVQVERPTAVPTPRVTADNRVGARQAIEHLVALGHRRIAFVGVEPSSLAGAHAGANVERERLDGYHEGLRAAGVERRGQVVILGSYAPKGDPDNVGNGYAYAEQWLAHDPRPTAALIGSDQLAAGFLQRLYVEGLRVPDDVSLVGFDDTYAAHLAPALSSVALPMFELGATAVALATGGDEREHVLLSTRLVVRESTAPPASPPPAGRTTSARWGNGVLAREGER